jgi:hypothetical protein
LEGASCLVSSQGQERAACVVVPSVQDNDHKSIRDYPLPNGVVLIACGPFYRKGANRLADGHQHDDQGQRTYRRIHTAWTMTTSGTRIPEKGHRRIKGKNEEKKDEKKLKEKNRKE